MLTLFIDTASQQNAFAVCTAEACLAYRQSSERIADYVFVPFLQSLVSQAGMAFADLQRVAMVTGPGGFTSLRVGIATGNALAYGLHIPAAGLQLSDWHLARTSKPAETLWVHSTRKTHAFVRRPGAAASDIELVHIDNIPSCALSASGWVGEVIPEHAPALANLLRASQVDATQVLPQALQALSYDSPPVLPWYGRGI